MDGEVKLSITWRIIHFVYVNDGEVEMGTTFTVLI